MNVGGHVAVALGLSDDPRVWLGAALPDLAAMGRFRLMGSTPSDAIAEGIRIHHASDDAFHRHPWFRSRQDQLRQRLEVDQGLARGAARAVAHVGPELLLDGALLTSNPGLHHALDAAMSEIGLNEEDLSTLVIAKVDEWPGHLRQVAEWPTPTDHHQPDAVAHRLFRILSRRPRLAMNAEDVATVERELEVVNPGITETADVLISDLISEIESLG